MLGWELPPYNSGGLGEACFQMSKSLAKKGAEIEFVVPYSADHPKAEEFMDVVSSGITPPMIDESGNYTAMGAYSGNCSLCKRRDCEHAREYAVGFVGATHRFADQVEKMFTEKQLSNDFPDVIHAHDWLTMEAGARAKRISRKPLVVHVHATEFDRAGGQSGNPLIHEIEYGGLVAADKIFAVSQLTKDIIVEKYKIPADKIEVVHNSLDVSGLTRVNEPTGDYQYVKKLRELGYKTVVNIGRLTVQKGLTYFIDAAAMAISRNPKLVFLISGSGEDRDQLIELAADRGISDKVIFFPFVRGRRWRELYELADIFVLPSVSEPFGLTPLEAAHYDTAILLSKTSGVGEVLNNVLRFDYWDSRKMADQIVNVSLSPALLTELRENVKREYLHKNWDDAADKMLTNYNKLILRNKHTQSKQFKLKMEAHYV